MGMMGMGMMGMGMVVMRMVVMMVMVMMVMVMEGSIPSYLLLSGYTMVPSPCLRPSAKSPSYDAPLAAYV